LEDKEGREARTRDVASKRQKRYVMEVRGARKRKMEMETKKRVLWKRAWTLKWIWSLRM
jgi:hypothetical protein